jgi:hypothetical protein
MERITKQELEEIVLKGIAADVFIAERAYSMFKIIGENGSSIYNSKYQQFFKSTQAAFKDQFLLAMSRLFDKPSDRNKTRCMLGVIDLIVKNSFRLPTIIERDNLILVMRRANFEEDTLGLLYQDGRDEEIALRIASHFKEILNSPTILRLIEKLKEIRDKRLAHNDLIESTQSDLTETIEVVTFKELFSLIDIVKDFVGIIGWAFMSMVFMHDGKYHLTSDAMRPSYLLPDLINKLSSELQ